MKGSLTAILKRHFPARFAGAVSLARRDAREIAHTQTFQPLGLQEFLSLELPPRAMLLSPILPERSLSMLYAPRGMGKSWLALSIGMAIASGAPLLRWTVPRPRRSPVCRWRNVVGGPSELDWPPCRRDLAAKFPMTDFASLQAGLGREIPNDGFCLLAADQTEFGINLSSDEGQRALEAHLVGVDLLILDNLSTLLASGSEGASDAWLPMQNWLLRLRRKGIAVLLIHHSGVNGRQRGTSRREVRSTPLSGCADREIIRLHKAPGSRSTLRRPGPWSVKVPCRSRRPLSRSGARTASPEFAGWPETWHRRSSIRRPDCSRPE